MTTQVTKLSDIKRDWHLVDLNGQILGRIATDIAQKLIGKHKPYFTANLDCGDYIVAVNAKKIQLTGKKAKQKMYYRHSGYPGGFKETSFSQQMVKDPAKIIIEAVKGMLPKNKLLSLRMKRLKVFADDKHTYEDKFVNKTK